MVPATDGKIYLSPGMSIEMWIDIIVSPEHEPGSPRCTVDKRICWSMAVVQPELTSYMSEMSIQ